MYLLDMLKSLWLIQHIFGGWRFQSAFNISVYYNKIELVLKGKMSKDAIMIAIDAGSSMDQPFSENASRLKIAM